MTTPKDPRPQHLDLKQVEAQMIELDLHPWLDQDGKLRTVDEPAPHLHDDDEPE